MTELKFNKCRDFYNNAASLYGKLNITEGTGSILAGMLPAHSGKKAEDVRILDAGCGTGLPAKSLIKHGFRQITLLDESFEMLEEAKKVLATEIKEGLIQGIYEESMPRLPFPENSFDVVNLSLVLYHVEGNSDGKTFPGTTETLVEATRVVRPGGLIAVTTITPMVMLDAVWFARLLPRISHQTTKHMPSVKQWETIFAECKLQCLAALRLLGPDQTGLWYKDAEGPLKKEWRNGFSYFQFATEDEMIDMEKRLEAMKKEGTLHKWIEDNDATHELGFYTMFICRTVE